MATGGRVKPYKLTPKDDKLTRDDVDTWSYNMQSVCRQVAAWQKFLPSGTTPDWSAGDEDPTHGLRVPRAAPNQDEDDAVPTDQLWSNFLDFLTCVATYCPAGFTNTVLRESTSFKWIIKTIKATFNLETKGENHTITPLKLLTGTEQRIHYRINIVRDA